MPTNISKNSFNSFTWPKDGIVKFNFINQESVTGCQALLRVLGDF